MPALNVFSQIPTDNLILWLKADNVEIIDDKVATWYDESSNEYNLIQSNVSNRPTIVYNSINALPVVRFDGINDYFRKEFSSTYSQPNTIFIVLKLNSDGNQYFYDGFSSLNAFQYWTGSIRLIAGGGFISYSEPSPLNLAVYSSIINGSNSKIYKNSIQKIAGTLGANTVTGITLGSYFGLAGYLNGDIAEIIYYNSLLSDSERLNVETYLMNKYSATINLGEDIIVDNGFCAVSLEIDSSFSEILWSTGETTPSIDVTEAGEYYVQAKDIFGRLQTDTINISFPDTRLTYEKTTICAGEGLLLSTNLGSEGSYTFEWSNGQSGHEITVTEAGDYWVEITDISDCVAFSDTVSISVDNFPLEYSIGDDKNLCSGNIIEAMPGENISGFTFLWLRDGDAGFSSSEPFIIVEETDNYTVEITNLNACIATDNLFVNIIGAAPFVDFDAEDVCLGNAVLFNDLSVAAGGDNISSWLWNFGGGNNSNEQHSEYSFSTAGSFNVTLTVEAESGCSNSITKSVTVKDIPTALFAFTESCVNYPVYFTDLSASPSDLNIIGWQWDFGDGNVSNEQNPQHTYIEPGTLNPELTVTLDNGCYNTNVFSLDVSSELPSPEDFTLIYPKNAQIIASSSVTFDWNLSENTYSYILEISDQPQMQNIIATYETENNQFTANISDAEELFWRVKAYNACRDTVSSEIKSFLYYSPSVISNLILWLSADSVEINSNNVSIWYDKSGNNYHLIQNESNRQPKFVENAIEGNPVVRFDGINDYFRLDFGNDYLQPNTIFLISKLSSNLNQYIFDGFNSFNAFQYWSGAFRFIATGTSTMQYIESTPTKYAYFSIIISGANSKILQNSIQRIGASLSPNIMNGITLGSSFALSSFLHGDLGEVIIFNKELTNNERIQVEQYLHHKYSPPINLGADIRIMNGFCPVTIDAGERFVNYLWNTGATTQSIEVNSPGIYSVTVTDIFGFQSIDSVRVRYPDVRLAQRDTIICFGDNLVLSAAGDLLPSYSYLWKLNNEDISTDASIIVSNEGTYELRIIDENSCFLSLQMELDVDMFSETTTLGEDRAFCMGSELEVMMAKGQRAGSDGQRAGSEGQRAARHLDRSEAEGEIPWGSAYQPGPSLTLGMTVHGTTVSLANAREVHGTSGSLANARDDVQGTTGSLANTRDDGYSRYPIPNTRYLSFLWSTGATTPSITITQPGEYFVTVINELGCVAQDTVNLSLQGYAPVVEIEAPAVCFGEPIVFTDNSSVDESEIVSWHWEFNDPGIPGGGNSSEQNPVFEYSTAGIFDINLTVISDAGCLTSITEQAQVYFLPQPNFTPANACHNVDVQFMDLSSSINGEINYRLWNFTNPQGDIAYQSESSNPVFLFDVPGDWNINLLTQTDKGCSNSKNTEILVRENPDIDFNYTTACIGEPVHFTNLTSGPAWTTVSKLQWDFGDGSQSSQNNPSHLYFEDGEYEVTLWVKAINGCEISLTKTIMVSANPEVDFETPPLCEDTPYVFEDASTVSTSEAVVAWSWNFGDGNSSALQNPLHTYSEPGQYNVSLAVETSAGCKAGANRLVDVFPAPISDFSFFPRYGVAPLVVNFENNSEGAQSYLWDFGDGSPASTLSNPTHTYTANGIYLPTLVATSALGCNDTTGFEIKVIPLSIDIAVMDVVIKRTGSYLEISASLFNLGTLDLDTLYLNIIPSQSRPIREVWTGLLRAGDIMNYTFNAQIPDYTGKDYDYICVEALIPYHTPDDNADNNYRCKALDEEFIVIPPYPNPAGNQLNTGFMLPFSDKVTVEIFDLSGNSFGKVFDESTNSGFTYISIDISHLRGGIYFLRVSFRDGTVVKRFVKS